MRRRFRVPANTPLPACWQWLSSYLHQFSRKTPARARSVCGDCTEAIQEHFDIVVYKKKKRIDWNSTAKQRLSFTNSCPGSDKGHNKLINDKYGKSSG
jgi:hypothetical protein